MTNQCVGGVFESVPQAEQAIHILDRAGFAQNHVSLVTRHIDPTSDVAKELNYGDDSLRDAAIGATLGGIAGIIGDAALFLIVGASAIVIAGPLVAATGMVVGAFLGAMEGWGVHKSHIEKYEQLVHEGKVLVVVDGGPKELAEADRMLRQAESTEVHLHAKSSADAAEIDDRP